MGIERMSGEAWENKGHILQESHSIYIWEVDLLGREVIPGRVGYWTGPGRQQCGRRWGLERKPRPSDFASLNPDTGSVGTCMNLGKLGIFEFLFPHQLNRKEKRKFKKIQKKTNNKTMTLPIPPGCAVISYLGGPGRVNFLNSLSTPKWESIYLP